MSDTSQKMIEKHAERRSAGLVLCSVYVPPSKKELLSKIVCNVLDGEYTPRACRTAKQDTSTGDLFRKSE